MTLPAPRTDGGLSLEQCLSTRRSIREYSPVPPSLEQLSQLLWAAQGVTDAEGHRTAPSAGGSYPLELLIATGEEHDLGAGLFAYEPSDHRLAQLSANDRRPAIVEATGQPWIANAPILVVIVAGYETTRERYGEKGVRHVHFEVGHVAQNVYLEATSLGVGTVMVGGFDDDELNAALDLPSDQTSLAVLPIGVLPIEATDEQ